MSIAETYQLRIASRDEAFCHSQSRKHCVRIFPTRNHSPSRVSILSENFRPSDNGQATRAKVDRLALPVHHAAVNALNFSAFAR